jgi:hypothetical protein
MALLGLACPAYAAQPPTTVPQPAQRALQHIPAKLIIPEVKKEFWSVKDQTLCLSLAIYHEARGIPLHEQIAVALVIRNRARLANTSICSIIWAENGSQFQWVRHARLTPREIGVWDDIQANAVDFLRHPPVDFTHGATHFYNPSTVTPIWGDPSKVTLRLQHVYLALPDFPGENTASRYEATATYRKALTPSHRHSRIK